MRTYLLAVIYALFLTVALAGCGDDTVAPVQEENEPVFVDVPDVPRPDSPGGDVPGTSETLSRIERFTGVFKPKIGNAYGHWLVTEEIPSFPIDPKVVMDDDAWSADVGDAFIRLFILEHMERLQLQDEDGISQAVKVNDRLPLGAVIRNNQFTGAAMEGKVHIRRDRRWELKPLEGGAGDFLLLDGNVTGEITTSYTKGVTRTQTEEFGRSVTAEGGLSLSALSAAVSGTLSETFTTSVSVSTSRTEEFKKTVSGKSGKYVQFMVWELVEEYTFCDENGDPVTDPNYVIPVTSMTRNGAGVLLQATEFDK